MQEVAVGSWQGPIISGFGQHLVFISARTEGRVPELDDVRDAVLQEWSMMQRKEANKIFYQELRARYLVSIERFDKKVTTEIAMAGINQ